MLNFLKNGLKSIKKDKAISFVIILGLAIGFTTLALITNYYLIALNYDNFHKNPDKIFKILIKEKNNENIDELSLSKYSEKLKNIKGIKAATKFFNNGNVKIYANDKTLKMVKSFFSEPDFFQVFSFDFIEGNNKVLTNLNEVVITESIAKKIWVTNKVIGKSINYDGNIFFVKAVIKDVPYNSHFSFDILFSYVTEQNFFDQVNNEFHTYFRIEDNYENKSVLKIAKNECESVYSEYLNKGFSKIDIIFQPILDIYLNSNNHKFKLSNYANINHLYILTIIAVCIFLITFLNFINLITVKLQKRIKEFSIKKILGAENKIIISQVLKEIIFLSLTSALIAILLTILLIKPFLTFFDFNVTLYTIELSKSIVAILTISILFGLIAPLLPLIQLFKHNNNSYILKKNNYVKKKSLMHLVMLIQFIIVTGLLVALFVTNDQLAYMKNIDLGFNKDQIIYFENEGKANYSIIYSELLKIKGLKKIGSSQSLPGTLHNGMTLCRYGANKSDTFSASENRIQKGFVDTYGLNIIEGRDFQGTNESEKNNIILNETAVTKLGYTSKEIINKNVIHLHGVKKVIGVVEDFHFSSLHTKIEPLILSNYSSYAGIYSMLINTNDYKTLINNIKQKLKKIEPSVNVDIIFLSDKINSLYISDEKETILINISTLICTLLAISGLIALTSFVILRRTNEIGIRKVLGATIFNIIIELSKNTFLLVLISSIIVIPISLYLLNTWLQNYYYRIQITANHIIYTLFLVGFLTTSAIAFFIIKASLKNPIDTIQHE